MYSETALLEYVERHTERWVLDHTGRVVENARDLGSILGADLRVLIPAALLHDIEFHNGFHGHGLRGAQRFRNEFGHLYSQDLSDNIFHCIESHPLIGAPKPETLEAQCLTDADREDNMRSFIPQIYTEYRSKYSEATAWKKTLRKVGYWYQSMTTDLGRSRFKAGKESLQKLYPALSELILD